jgi:amidase
MTPETWQTIVAAKQASVIEKIPTAWRLSESYLEKVSEDSLESVLSVPRECGLLSPVELEITDQHDVVSLVHKLAEGTFTAEQVTTAFSKRAAIAQQLVSCLLNTGLQPVPRCASATS